MARSRQDRPPPPPVPAGDLGALRQEFAQVGVGPRFLAEVRTSAYRLIGRYNAAVYSDIGNWRHGFDDLVQDVVSDSLLRDQQAAYILEVADTIEDFRRLLTRQVRRRLARRRVRTVLDNLIDRARPILEAPPFEQRTRHQHVAYCLAGLPAETRAATFRELQLAASAFRSLPQRGRLGGERAPMVFTTPHLTEALRRFALLLPPAFTLNELDRALRLALPQFLPSVLDTDDHHEQHHDGDVEGVEADHQVVSAAADTVIDELGPDGCVVIAMKLAGASDAEIATRLNLKRRTATNRKRAAFAVLEDVLGPLHYAERLAVLKAAGPRLRGALIQT